MSSLLSKNNRNYLLLALLGLSALPLIGQERGNAPTSPQSGLSVKLENFRQITSSADYWSAVWSPADPRVLAFTSKDGTYLYREDGGKSRRLTTHAAGFKYVWTSDGLSLVFRSRTSERTLAIERIDVQTGEKSVLDQSPDLGLPQRVGQGMIAYRKERAFEKLLPDKTVAGAAVRPYAYQDQDDIFVVVNESVTRINPHKGSFFLPQVSPDGSKVLYEELSTGMLVTDLSSGKTVSLGRGDDPTWLPDSKGIIFELTEDDGHTIVRSDLYFTDLQGRRSRLTATVDKLEMRPSISPDGRRVAFDAGGAIYVADLVVED